MAVKVFIDGQAGTTGLRIHERLADRKDLTMITLTEETRKDPEARRAAILESDVTFLCLPDDAARICFLKRHRRRLMESLHAAQEKLSCIDYMIYELEQRQKKA